MEALQFQLVAIAIFILALVIGVVLWSVPLAEKFRGSVIPGIMRVEKRSYEYQLGDQILRYGGAAVFSGIQLTLPQKLPHIFLDAHANDKLAQPKEFVFDEQNRVSLEGDFDTYFQAYAPAEHKTLALSILTPDVLQTVIKYGKKYDIEIMEDKVRLIIPGDGVRVSRTEQLQHDLLDAAQQLMQEVDHRLQSWQESSLQGDTALDIRRVNRRAGQ
jgi:hypothetical protein